MHKQVHRYTLELWSDSRDPSLCLLEKIRGIYLIHDRLNGPHLDTMTSRAIDQLISEKEIRVVDYRLESKWGPAA